MIWQYAQEMAEEALPLHFPLQARKFLFHTFHIVASISCPVFAYILSVAVTLKFE
jgi:hypothetical protein